MTEQQPYDLVHRYPHFELRRYPAYVVAEIRVTANFDRAGNAAFRHLFNYISGSNTTAQKIAMTAPVVQSESPGSPATGPAAGVARKLAMTAPVLQSGPLPGDGASADFTVAFVLPAGMTADTAPVPTSPGVRIRAVPGTLSAALRFTGRGTGQAFARHNDGLQAALTLAGLTVVGRPRFARFDPPFKPWFLRRNEVVQDVQEAEGPAGTEGVPAG